MSPNVPDLTNDNYAFLQAFVQRESGIALGQDKLYLLKSRLLPIVERERLRSLDELCDRKQSLLLVSRPASPSPAVGYYSRHNAQQKALIESALGEIDPYKLA